MHGPTCIFWGRPDTLLAQAATATAAATAAIAAASFVESPRWLAANQGMGAAAAALRALRTDGADLAPTLAAIAGSVAPVRDTLALWLVSVVRDTLACHGEAQREVRALEVTPPTAPRPARRAARSASRRSIT
jgi:hypothetical protein